MSGPSDFSFPKLLGATEHAEVVAQQASREDESAFAVTLRNETAWERAKEKILDASLRLTQSQVTSRPD